MATNHGRICIQPRCEHCALININNCHSPRRLIHRSRFNWIEALSCGRLIHFVYISFLRSNSNHQNYFLLFCRYSYSTEDTEIWLVRFTVSIKIFAQIHFSRADGIFLCNIFTKHSIHVFSPPNGKSCGKCVRCGFNGTIWRLLHILKVKMNTNSISVKQFSKFVTIPLRFWLHSFSTFYFRLFRPRVGIIMKVDEGI